jgi:iron complex transport system permease protein
LPYFFLLSGLVILLAPCVGGEWILPDKVLTAGTLESDIFWGIRFPRVLVSFLSGAGLAVSGMAFQALFRNPLATPFTLGVASGASFSAVLAAFFGLSFFIGSYAFPGVFALAGALGTVLLVYGLACLSRRFSADTLLLIGVAINYFFASAVVFLQYLSDYTNVFRILRTLLGGFEGVGYSSLLELLPFVVPGVLILASLCYELNLIAMGDDIAAGRGLDLAGTRKLLFLATSLMVGGTVAVSGPIGFVGMMAPHLCRLLIGTDHRFLMPATFCVGGILLSTCDTVARTVIAPAEIPVGALTALLGGPFFLWLLLRRNNERSV